MHIFFNAYFFLSHQHLTAYSTGAALHDQGIAQDGMPQKKKPRLINRPTGAWQ